jgi:hypothetical protein
VAGRHLPPPCLVVKNQPDHTQYNDHRHSRGV